MEKSRSALAEISFGKLDSFHKFEVQNLAHEMGAGIEFEEGDVLSFLSDWHACANDSKMREKIEAVGTRILHADLIGRRIAAAKSR